MPAPYTLTLAPVVGIDSEITTNPTEQVVLTLLPVLKGDAGSGGGASQEYVDNGDADTLTSANAYTNSVLSDKADLVGGFVPASQLPSFVDDVLEGTLIDLTTFDDLFGDPYTPESGKIYLDITTNLQYRWGGSSYVTLNPSLALGETSSTAYRGDRGKTAYDHSQTVGNPHGTTAAQITGLATVAISNNYNDLDNLPVGGGSSLSFDDSRWGFNEMLYPAATGGFFGAAISSGTLLYNSTITGAFGVATINASASANSGAAVATNAFVFVQEGLLVRSIFQLSSSVASRVVRIGVLNGVSAASESYGAYVNIANQTATANTANGAAPTTQGSVVLPLNTLLVCDVEYVTASSARLVVFNKTTNIKYLDETISATLPFGASTTTFGIKAFAASSSGALISLDYIGAGIKRPSFIVTPV